ncbi:hypothetical protein IEQ34_005557 [Dendrobium chrysotoxum]|uniref:Uncharacterized protein n=1 Tax=Dendrobium chrysotoxum TaxID=161865 RepID=A0AAV7HCK7_DENCH|nr:hypothetical protein IEQ34_005557 [Dendrobium chrysotoxum]
MTRADREIGEDEGSICTFARRRRGYNNDPQRSRHRTSSIRGSLLEQIDRREFLFKVGLSFHAGRSDASMLKMSSKVPEPPAIASKVAPKRQAREKIAVLEAENKRSQTLIAEKEAALFSLESLRAIKDFKKSIAFKTIIQTTFRRLGVRLVQRKTGVEVEGLTPVKLQMTLIQILMVTSCESGTLSLGYIDPKVGFQRGKDTPLGDSPYPFGTPDLDYFTIQRGKSNLPLKGRVLFFIWVFDHKESKELEEEKTEELKT